MGTKSHEIIVDLLSIRKEPSIAQALNELHDCLQQIDLVTIFAGNTNDPIIRFYELFLHHYSKQKRVFQGVYYTPDEIVGYMVRSTHRLLQERFGLRLGLADTSTWAEVAQKNRFECPDNVDPKAPFVQLLDPATGSGTFLKHSLELIRNTMLQEWKDLDFEAKRKSWKHYLTAPKKGLLNRFFGFELMVTPFLIANLRIAQVLRQAGPLAIPEEIPIPLELHLCNTLERRAPSSPGYAEWWQSISHIKNQESITVVLGNPPYKREKKGSPGYQWVRSSLLNAYRKPTQKAGLGTHFKNAYNLYVYFWRWAEWKLSHSAGGYGVITLITPSSFLRGEGFFGLRKVWADKCEHIQITDLEGNQRGFRKTANVFDIQSPVAITSLVLKKDTICSGLYRLQEGSKAEKWAYCRDTNFFESNKASPFSTQPGAPFMPRINTRYNDFIAIHKLFPWQQCGVKVGRTWPISASQTTLISRLESLINSDVSRKQTLFKESPSGRKVSDHPFTLPPKLLRHETCLAELRDTQPLQDKIIPYSYRAFDTSYLIADGRLIDRPSPSLWHCHSGSQLYFAGIMKKPNVCGPALVATRHIPDLDFLLTGGKDIFPMYRNPEATKVNINHKILSKLEQEFGQSIKPQALYCYAIAVMGNPGYTRRFSSEMRSTTPKLPLTRDATLFNRGAVLGRRLISIQTSGQDSRSHETHSPGLGRYTNQNRYLHGALVDFRYDSLRNVLRICNDENGWHDWVKNLRPEIYDFSISGLKVIPSWLASRTTMGSGKRSSPLDEMRIPIPLKTLKPNLQILISTIEKLHAFYPDLDAWLQEVLQSPLFSGGDLPKPTADETKAPRVRRSKTKRP